MQTETYTLSVDEVAMGLAQIGEPAVARALMEEQAGGKLSRQALEGRLTAAGHALMARGLLRVDDDGTVHVDASFRSVLEPLASADYSLRVSRISDGPEEMLSYHVRGSRVVEHVVERDVIHHIRMLEDADAIMSGASAFLDVHSSPTIDAAFDVPAAMLDEMQETTDIETIRAMLEESHVEPQGAARFAEDFVGVEWRGAVLRVEYAGDELRSDRGVLVLRGPERAWLMRVEPNVGNARLHIQPLTPDTLSHEIDALVA